MGDYLKTCEQCWKEYVPEISLTEYTYLSEIRNLTDEEIVQEYIPEEKERQWQRDQEEYEEFLQEQEKIPF